MVETPQDREMEKTVVHCSEGAAERMAGRCLGEPEQRDSGHYSDRVVERGSDHCCPGKLAEKAIAEHSSLQNVLASEVCGPGPGETQTETYLSLQADTKEFVE